MWEFWTRIGLLLKKQNTAEEGDIIVAIIENEVTVKRFYRGHNYIRLQPENDFYNPIIVRSDRELKILGKVIGLVRKLN